eukprot:642992-Pyramimonas_sp.AAC.1
MGPSRRPEDPQVRESSTGHEHPEASQRLPSGSCPVCLVKAAGSQGLLIQRPQKRSSGSTFPDGDLCGTLSILTLSCNFAWIALEAKRARSAPASLVG